MLIFFPIIPAFKVLALFGYFLVSSVYIGSCGTITLSQVEHQVDHSSTLTSAVNTTSPSNESPNVMRYLLMYNLFGILWTYQVIEAIAICTIAGSICRYYWAEDKEKMGWSVLNAFYYSIRYHFGSLAFGALVIAIVQFVRLILEYIDRKTHSVQNKAVQVVVCCCRACLYCLHKFVKFLSSNGYIIIAMKGTNFCVSITDAFNLVAANLMRIGTLSLVSTYVIIVGKILISSSCTLAMYWYITTQIHYAITSPFPPLIATAILSYAIACLFLSVFEVAVDTVLLSVCEDEKINRSVGSYYAGAEILAFLDNSAAHAFKHHKLVEEDVKV